MSSSSTPNSDAEKTNEVKVAIIATETTTNSAEPSLGDDLRRRSETITVVLEKILEPPPPSLHWGINE